MRKRPFGPVGRELPVVGQGTWRATTTPGDPAAALRRGVDLGMTLIDTAEIYGHGAVETLVGETLHDRRDEIFLVTKVWHENASREGTIAACEGSLERLRTDAIDLYLLHWPSTHPLEGTFAAFETLLERGKIRAYGVSNFDAPLLRRALALAPPGRLAANQVVHHLRHRGIEREVLPLCAEHDVAIMAYSPFGSDDGFPEPGSALGRVLADVAAAHGATPRQVALAFLLRHEGVFVIPKANHPRHVEENARAGDLVLSADEIARIDRAAPIGEPGWPAVP